jgi:putative DNA primase/helicase
MTAIPKAARCAEWHAQRGIVITPTRRGIKGPRGRGWSDVKNAIIGPEAALQHYTRNPEDGAACLLGPSGLVSVDIDDEVKSKIVFSHFDIDLDQERASAPTIVGRRFRMMFKASPDVQLKHQSQKWPKQDNPRANAVNFELRAGNAADMLPPSIHATTGLPYVWENPPVNGFKPLPKCFLDLWLDWPEFNRKALALCPWWTPPPPAPPRTERRERAGKSVIAEFNALHDVAAILESHGYQRRGKRFGKPDSGHDAGIVVLDDGRKIYCHHAGDLLHSEHKLDAFDLYRLLQHNGDFRSAVRTAAEILGIEREAS